MSVSDDDRTRFEDDLLAALLLVYTGAARAALAQLGVSGEPEISDDTQATLAAFAAERATLVQTGVNARIDALDPDAADEMLVALRQEIEAYNRTTLIPYMTRWASQHALEDTYRQTPASDGSDRSALDEHDWEWAQETNFEDSCSDAANASPASHGDLVALAGSSPPAHEGCQCSLTPV
jgi:hypothetical protein